MKRSEKREPPLRPTPGQGGSHSSLLHSRSYSRRLVLTKTLIAILIAAALAATASMTMGTATFAHDDEELGGNRIVVGFLNEPAYEGERNAVSIRVTKGAQAGMRIPAAWLI